MDIRFKYKYVIQRIIILNIRKINLFIHKIKY